MSLLLLGWIAAAAFIVLLTLHTLYATLGLLLVVLGMAAFYFLQGAAFVAVVQVMVYGGGLLVLLLFSLMLLPLAPAPSPKRAKNFRSLWAAGLLSGGLWPLSYYAVQILPQERALSLGTENAVTSWGLQLLGPYAFVFEWAALSLLIALVGAIYVVQLPLPNVQRMR
ncbi:MAG: NADH-quinone oxidoreductase subunit J [Roseivirga sp.]